MKKFSKVLAVVLTLSMLLSVSAFASGEPSGEIAAPAAAATNIPATANTTDVGSYPPSEFARLSSDTNRDDTGNIYVGTTVTEGTVDVALDDTVTGPAFTAVFASGEMATANVTGTLVLTDDTDGQLGSDFSGQGAAFAVMDNATLNVTDATVYTDGFVRTGIIISANGSATVKNSTFTTMGANPLTEAWDGYVNSPNMGIMLSPPWVLGISGAVRSVNMLGANPTLNVIDSSFTTGGWAVLSTDGGSNHKINVVDSSLAVLPESKGGMDSGWRIFGYDEDAYGTGYGTYYIGNPNQNFYGATFDGMTYGAIITGASAGHYASSNGSIDLYDAKGEYMETVQGAGQPTVINAVFGFMMHNSINDGIYVEDGTIVNAEDAIVIYKAANGSFYFDNAKLNSGTGVLFQMIDNDDDSRIGLPSMAEGFSSTYDESKIGAGIGFPGITYDYTSGTGGNDVNVTYTNGAYNGDINNGTGYYNQNGDNLNLTVGEGALLNGAVALTSTIKGVPYSASALEGVKYYGDDITYTLLDAEGNVTDEANAAFIQFNAYTDWQYFLQGHVQNLIHYNGASTIAVTVENGGVWVVSGESLVTSLTVAADAVVYGDLVENADGTVTLTPSANVVAAGTYGGTITAVGGADSVGGGVTADGVLDVEAAAAQAQAQGAGGSGEPSAEPTAAEVAPAVATSLSGEAGPSVKETVIVINGEQYVLDLYIIDGVEYVKLADLVAATSDSDVTWADYQDYLYNASVNNAPDADEWYGQVYGANSWEDFDLTTSPWDQLFTTVGLSTWAEFVAQGGTGAASAVEGAMG